MLDAARMGGRWISQTLLGRITARTLEFKPPPRQGWLKELGQSAQRRHRLGALSLRSVNVRVQRSENSSGPAKTRTEPFFADGHYSRVIGGAVGEGAGSANPACGGLPWERDDGVGSPF
jgi:hypothetical protein